MSNKVLITVLVPYLEKEYDVFIPVNRKIYTVMEMIEKSLNTLSLGLFPLQKKYYLYSECTGQKYDINTLVRDTDIRNNTKVILI